jgi:NAD(P)-dependent dehydrogenase (short-subunit alcohol dehydrogenase family)
VTQKPVAVVTGGTRGIGLACSLRLASRGLRVVAFYKGDASTARTAATLIEDVQPGCSVWQVDVLDPTAIRAAVEKIVSDLGPPALLVNSAGVQRRARFLDVTEDDFDTVFGTNVRGLYFSCQAAARAMAATGGGRIINISSIAANYTLGDRSVYEASKSAVERLTRSLAVELAPVGISVNAVSPGLIETALTLRAGTADIAARIHRIPMARVGTVEEVAAVVTYLAIDAPDYVTGTVVQVDGGRSST